MNNNTDRNTKGLEEVRRQLALHGACRLADGLDSWESAVALIFTPQGREFAKKTGFPGIGLLREHKDILNTFEGVYIDCINAETSASNVFIAGNTRAEIHASGAESVHKVVAMHGAVGTLHASGHSVCTVSVSTGARVMTECDTTSIISTE